MGRLPNCGFVNVRLMRAQAPIIHLAMTEMCQERTQIPQQTDGAQPAFPNQTFSWRAINSFTVSRALSV